MPVSEPDIKRLWGKSAGRCSFPSCGENCIQFLEQSGETIIGEMAHVIAQSQTGPRGKRGASGPDAYENMILLCPTHHTLVDKAPDDFSELKLREWKMSHERRVEEFLRSPTFDSKSELYGFARKVLAENHVIHKSFGPESLQARANPLSEGATIWDLRKTATIIPNNQRIINAFERHQDLISEPEWSVFVQFREHALAFERNAYRRTDRDLVPRFPMTFSSLVGEG